MFLTSLTASTFMIFALPVVEFFFYESRFKTKPYLVTIKNKWSDFIYIDKFNFPSFYRSNLELSKAKNLISNPPANPIHLYGGKRVELLPLPLP